MSYQINTEYGGSNNTRNRYKRSSRGNRRQQMSQMPQMPQTPMVLAIKWTWWVVSSTIFLVILFYLIGVANGRRISSYSCACTNGEPGVVTKVTPYYKNIVFG
jgi:hypothetical protein